MNRHVRVAISPGPRDDFGGLRVQAELAGLEVRLQAVLSIAPPVERSKKASLPDSKGGGLQVAGPDGRLDPTVVFRTSDVDPELSGVQADVLVANDVLDRELAGRELNGEVRPFRHRDDGAKVVARTVDDDGGVRAVHLDVRLDPPKLTLIPNAPLKVNSIVLTGRDPIPAADRSIEMRPLATNGVSRESAGRDSEPDWAAGVTTRTVPSATALTGTSIRIS